MPSTVKEMRKATTTLQILYSNILNSDYKQACPPILPGSMQARMQHTWTASCHTARACKNPIQLMVPVSESQDDWVEVCLNSCWAPSPYTEKNTKYIFWPNLSSNRHTLYLSATKLHSQCFSTFGNNLRKWIWRRWQMACTGAHYAVRYDFWHFSQALLCKLKEHVLLAVQEIGKLTCNAFPVCTLLTSSRSFWLRQNEDSTLIKGEDWHWNLISAGLRPAYIWVPQL